jgi:hypothetical protein
MALASVLDEELEERSKSLFNNRHMLNVAGAIASRPRLFSVSELVAITGVPYSSTYRLVRQLERVGLVSAAPGKPGDQHRVYRRTTHKFWGAVQQLRGPATGTATGSAGTARGDRTGPGNERGAEDA